MESGKATNQSKRTFKQQIKESSKFKNPILRFDIKNFMQEKEIEKATLVPFLYPIILRSF